MIRFFILFLWSASAWSAGLSVDLYKVALPDFLRVVYGELLNKSYILDVPVVSDQDLFTLVLRDMSNADIEREVGRVLELRGYRIDSQRGVIVVSKGFDPSQEDVIVYRPAHRSVSYLLPLVESLFKPGSFVSRGRGGGMTLNQLGYGGYGSGSGFGSSSGFSQSVPTSLGGGVNGGMPTNQTMGQGFPDSGLNAQLGVEQDVIVFKGSNAEIDRFRKLVAQVDVSASELLVKAVVLEVQTSQTEGSAVDLVLSLLKSRIGLNLTGGADVSGGGNGQGGGNVYVKFSGMGVDLSAVYSALSGDSRFKVLTSPRLRVRSGSAARFSVGNETPILGSVSYDSNGRPVQNVNYKPSGVIFELRPNIRAGSTELSVMQQISNFTSTTNGVNNSPTLIKREIKTDVVAVDGDLILLGGLDEDRDTGSSTGLSFLPSFFRSSSSERTKTEIVLMIQADRI